MGNPFSGCLGGLAAVIIAVIGIGAANVLGITPIGPEDVSPPAPVAQAIVGPLPDLQPALPAPAVAASQTPTVTPLATATASAAPTTASTTQPPTTQPPTAPPTHTPAPTPACTESYSPTITYSDDLGSHTLSGGPTWSYTETEPQGHAASATISQFKACGHDHLVFTISDHSNNYSCDPRMQPPISVSIHTYASPETVTITARFGSGC